MTAALVPLAAVVAEIPASLHTIYAYSRGGRGVWRDWITRLDSDGRRGRHLLVNVDAAREFWRNEGAPHVGDRIARAAAAWTRETEESR